MGKGGLGDMMKQLQKMQAKMEEVQTELANTHVEGSAGGGMVTATLNGRNDVLSIKIDPEVVDKDEVEMLQDLIVAALNQAREKVQEVQQEQMSGLTGGINIPGLNLPF